ncbi:IclR family transcriptional regulator [Cupriavidus consociatus]|uniref:IclR family transcriptional regulator n=1 Tax=Cupriavidus consociatus TaxID=2821357 RepID=UPI001AE791DC|nr:MULTISPECIES: helix-turn-helix domain-containing protein [unclassified Cupriavidus]MBP0619545.1 helix-turn-helix domain-containing protein [Cupriavidus sp. LEh25]MDK2656195.1 helix-turn-helix domain-containing protein [Cupriavidus sp. LEh21]
MARGKATGAAGKAEREGKPEKADKAQRGIQSVEVGGRLLAALAAARVPMPLAALAEAAQLAPAQAHAYLVSLTRLGLLKRDHVSGRYEPGPLSLQLGMLHLEQDPAYRAALPRVDALAQSSGFSVAISVAGPQGPTIVRYVPASAPLHVNLHVGTVMALAATATGRVYCAFRPPALWQPLWRAQQPDATDAQLADFGSALQAIRERGIERSIDTPSPAVSSLSVPVLDAVGALRLVLTLVGSTGAIDVDWNGTAARALMAAAGDIAAALRAEGPEGMEEEKPA